MSGTLNSSLTTSLYLNGAKGVAIINSTANPSYTILAKMNSKNGVFTMGYYTQGIGLWYLSNDTISANINSPDKENWIMTETGDIKASGSIYEGGTTLANKYLSLSGGTMTGSVTFSNGLAITYAPQDTAIPYYLGINAFADGGTVRWTSAATMYANVFKNSYSINGSNPGSNKFWFNTGTRV